MTNEQSTAENFLATNMASMWKRNLKQILSMVSRRIMAILKQLTPRQRSNFTSKKDRGAIMAPLTLHKKKL